MPADLRLWPFAVRFLFSGAFAVAGIYLLRAVFLIARRRRDVMERGIVTDGEIIAFESKVQTRDTVRVEAPVVNFITRDGARLQFTSSLWQHPNPYTAGQHVPVRYLPDDPKSADLAAVTEEWWPMLALVAAAVVVLVIATLPFLLAPNH
jgi:uncharacterized protein DUF3592